MQCCCLECHGYKTCEKWVKGWRQIVISIILKIDIIGQPKLRWILSVLWDSSLCAHQCNNTQKWQMCSCTDVFQVGLNCTCIIQATTSFQWWDQRTEKVKLRQICCPCSPSSCWYSMVLMATKHGVHKLWVGVHRLIDQIYTSAVVHQLSSNMYPSNSFGSSCTTHEHTVRLLHLMYLHTMVTIWWSPPLSPSCSLPPFRRTQWFSLYPNRKANY
jgi:hypothetical protein